MPTATSTSTATPAPVAAVINTANIQNLTETLRLMGSSDRLNSIAVSPDGLQLAAASSAGITRFQLPDFAPMGFIVEGNVGQIAWSPDGNYIASNGRTDGWCAFGKPIRVSCCNRLRVIPER